MTREVKRSSRFFDGETDDSCLSLRFAPVAVIRHRDRQFRLASDHLRGQFVDLFKRRTQRLMSTNDLVHTRLQRS